MKYLLLLIALAYLAPGVLGSEQYRDFTSADGKTIRGAVKGYDARTKSVTIERDNRKTATVPVSVFSEADQAYILEWDAAKGFLSNSLLKTLCDDRLIERRKEKEISDINYVGGEVITDFEKTETTVECIAYDIQFQNMGNSNLQGIRMEYRIYYEQSEIEWDKKPEAKQKVLKEEMAIPPLAGKSKTTVTTKPIEIHKDSINVMPIAGGDLRSGGKGEIHGLRARLYMKMPSGQEVMREFQQPGSLSEEQFPWTD